MTINVGDVRNEYTATAGQTVFTYTFKIFASTDLNVYQTPAGQVADDTTDIITGYTVSGVGNEDGGTITLNTGATVGDLITIVSDIPGSRTTDYQTNGDFLPDVVNADFDRVVSLVKQAEEAVSRTLQGEESQQGSKPLSLPEPVAGRFLKWRGDLSGMENVPLGVNDLDVAAYQLSDYASLAAAVADIGSTVAELWIDTSDTLTANVTAPSTLFFRPIPGNTINGSFTFTAYSPEHILGGARYQVFGSTLTVVFTKTGDASLHWFGFDENETAANNNTFLEAAFTAVGAGGTVTLHGGGTYLLDPTTLSNNDTTFRSTANYVGTILHYASGTGTLFTVDADRCLLEGFYFQGPQAGLGNGDVGLKFANAEFSNVTRNCRVANFDTCVLDDGFGNVFEDVYIVGDGAGAASTYGLKVDAASSGHFRGGYIRNTQTCAYINSTHYEMYSTIIGGGGVTNGVEYDNNSGSLLLSGVHFEDAAMTTEIKTTQPDCQVTLLGGRLKGLINGNSVAARIKFDGPTFTSNGGDISLTGCTTTDFVLTGLDSSIDIDDIFASAVGRVKWLDYPTFITGGTAATSGTGEDDLRSKDLPQYSHNALKAIKVFGSGEFTGTAGNKTVKFYMGTDSFEVVPAINNNDQWKATVTVYFQSATDLYVDYEGVLGDSGGPVTSHYHDFQISSSNDFDAGLVAVKFTGECANAADEITQRIMLVEWIW